MGRIVFAIFLILHGLVHGWLMALSLKWVEFKPDMGWNGRSWLFSSFLADPTVRLLAAVGFGAAIGLFLISGVGFFLQTTWAAQWLLAAAIFSSLWLILFWDGKVDLIVQKGLIGLLINLSLMAWLLLRSRG